MKQSHGMVDYQILNMAMQGQCGQCQNPFWQGCLVKTQCIFHNSQCFSCRPCHQEFELKNSDMVQCFFCERTAVAEELFYCNHCGNYICHDHFAHADLSQPHFLTICQNLQSHENIRIYTRNFCNSCSRKLPNNDNDLVQECHICLLKGSGLKKEEEKEEGPPMEIAPQKTREEVENHEQPKNQEEEGPTKAEMQAKIDSLQKVKGCLEGINKLLSSESRERACIFCYQDFNLSDRKPIMLCMNQHVYCQLCYNKPDVLNCPLCCAVLDKSSPKIHRERLLTLQLQTLVENTFQETCQTLDFKPTIEGDPPEVKEEVPKSKGEGEGKEAEKSEGQFDGKGSVRKRGRPKGSVRRGSKKIKQNQNEE